MRLLRAGFFLLALLALLGSGLPAAGAEHVYQSERLAVRGAVPERWIDTTVRLADALYPALEAHFGRGPAAAELPLRLVLFPTRARYEAALRDAGVRGTLGHSGGWTFWKKGVSYVFLQKDAWHTRRLILHELTHQFHARCRPPSRRGKGAWWYREGLAEYFGWHHRTRTGIEFGQVAELGRRGTATEARARVLADRVDPWKLGTREERSDYAEALALVAPLIAGPDADLVGRFRAWEREVLERGGDAPAFERHFGPVRDRLPPALQAFWKEATPAREAVHGAWRRDRGVVVGQATDGAGMLRLPDGPAARSQVQVTVPAGAEAGLGVAGLGSEVAAFLGPGHVAFCERGAAGAPWRVRARLPLAHEGTARIEILRETPPSWHKLSHAGFRFRVRAPDGASVAWPPAAESPRLLGFDGTRVPLRLAFLVRRGSASFRDFQTGPAAAEAGK